MVDNPAFKGLEEQYFQGEKIYNYGGFIPEIIIQQPPSPSPSPTPSITPSITPTITPTATGTATPTPTPSFTPTPSGSLYDPDYEAVLNYATSQGWTLPTDGQKTLQNQLVVDLKTFGIWTDLDIFYVFATDGDEDYAKINWRQPGNFTILENGSVGFTTNQGFKPTSASLSNYLSTQYNPATSATGYTLNDASRFIWDFDGSAGGQQILDGILSSPSNIMISSNTSLQRINQGTTNLNAASYNNTGTGLKMIQRTSSTNVNMYKNSVQSSFAGTNSSSVASSDQLIFRRASNGSGDMTASIYGMGASLSGMETDLYNAIDTYMTSI